MPCEMEQLIAIGNEFGTVASMLRHRPFRTSFQRKADTVRAAVAEIGRLRADCQALAQRVDCCVQEERAMQCSPQAARARAAGTLRRPSSERRRDP